MLLEDLMYNYEGKSVETINEETYLDLYNESMKYNPKLKEVDACFDRILKSGGNKKRNMFDKKIIEKEFSKVERLFDKIFNIDCNITLDDKTKRLEYAACIEISADDIKLIAEEIIESKEGYCFKTVRHTNMWIQDKLLELIKENNLSAKCLTGVLLHEIGHKVFLKINTKYDKEANIMILTISGTIATVNIAGFVAASIEIMLVSILVYVIGSIIMFDIQNKAYLKGEINCDNMAVEYGYSSYLYELFVIFNDNKNLSSYKHKKGNAHYMFKRLTQINDKLDQELNDATNEKDRKVIRDAQDKIREIESNKNYSLKFNKDSLFTKIKGLFGKGKNLKEDYIDDELDEMLDELI